MPRPHPWCFAIVLGGKPVRIDPIWDGHGAMLDLAHGDLAAKVIGAAWNSGKVVASVCHGSEAFAKVVIAKGDPMVKGRKVATLTDSEEAAVGRVDAVPFLLETKLRKLGAKFESTADWQPHAMADGRLGTGRNPVLLKAAAEKVLDPL